MKALITGASSGIGRDMARVLNKLNYDLILVARDKGKLENLKKELKGNIKILCYDLSNVDNCNKLYNEVKQDNINVLINNAGFGLIGEFNKTSLDGELNMIDLNIKAVHTLTKLFLSDFIKKDCGYILNVSSSASFTPGPLMTTYYSTKAYITSFTLALSEELKQQNSNVHISCLCPGPVDTNFNNVANCEFKVKSLPSEYVARYAINKMFKNKLLIIPGFNIKLLYFFLRFLPTRLKLKLTYNIQYKKTI